MAIGVSITGLGLVTSVGEGAAQACAAIRANVVRSAPIQPAVTVMDVASNEPGLVVGCPVRGLTNGFQGLGRLKRLGAAALRDLQREVPGSEGPEFWSDSQIYLCLGLDVEDRMQVEAQDLATLGQGFGDTIGARPPVVLTRGHAAVFEAIQLASEELQRRRIRRALVLAVDSLLDEESVDWLIQQQRLKTLESPVGLIPGEAAACLVIELPAASGAGTAPLLDAVHTIAPRPADQEGAASHVARSLSQALGALLASSSPGSPGDLILNLNGEERGATVWGAVLSYLAKEARNWRPRMIAPQIQLGDVGAAFGAVAVCLAVRSLSRHHARGDEVLLAAISPEGAAGFCRIRR